MCEFKIELHVKIRSGTSADQQTPTVKTLVYTAERLNTQENTLLWNVYDASMSIFVLLS
jgi:hypothetical protein